MSHLENYLEHIEKTTPGISDGVRKSVTAFSRKYLEKFNYTEHSCGLLAGHVQSGKTSHMLGIAASASDIDFRYFIILTTDNIRLQKQTIQRAKASLKDIAVCDEKDDLLFRSVAFSRPVLLVLKKNKRVLETWHRFLYMSSKVRMEPLIIFDDEGDAASLNTKVNQKSVSTISSLITNIISSSPSSLYLSVTATPYANLLQTEKSAMKPSFVHVFQPGAGYLGGDHFYGSASDCISLISEREKNILLDSDGTPLGLKKATAYFLFLCAESKFLKKKDVCNFLVHPSLKIRDHKIVAAKIEGFLKTAAYETGRDKSFFKEWAGDLFAEFGVFSRPFGEYWTWLKKTLRYIRTAVVNSETAQSDFSKGFNIIVGGNSLGRGMTFPCLQVTYYCRTAKIPQADTVWQHSRMFGYDRDPVLSRIFLTASLLHLFRELTASNNALLSVFEQKGLEGITILTPKGARPTRKNVILRDALVTYVGGVNYFTTDVEQSGTPRIDAVLQLKSSTKYFKIQDVIDILELLCRREETEVDTYIACLLSLRAAGFKKCLIHIRPYRNITKGTGTLLSPNDRLLSREAPDDVVFFMYRLNGGKAQGWDGQPFWVPNMRLPQSYCFYGAEE